MAYTDDPDVSAFEPKIDSLIRNEGIDVSSPKADFVRAIYGQESSSGANTKTSNRGAAGGMQVRPDTFKQVYPDGDPKNADHQLIAGIRYANQGYDAAKGDPKLAATYYYGGPGGMAQAQKGIAVSDPVNPKNPNTLQYADQVVARMPKTGGYDYENDPDVAAFGGKAAAPQTTSGVSDFLRESMQKRMAQQKGTEQIVGQGLKEAGEKTAGMLDVLYGGTIPAAAGTVAQTVANAAGGITGLFGNRVVSPERAEQLGQNVTEAFSHPLGKLFGITGEQAYQQPLNNVTANVTAPLAKQVNHLFNDLGLTPEQISEKTGIPAANIRNIVNVGSYAVPNVVAEVVSPAAKAFSNAYKTVENMAVPQGAGGQMAQQFAAKKGAMGYSGGAAATTTATDAQAALAQAPEHIQQAFAGRDPASFTPKEIEAINNHSQFARFDMSPTEGQALQDAKLMSDEHNERNLPGNEPLQKKFEERNDKLIQGFDKVRENVAPDVYETTPVSAANLALEKMVANDNMRKSVINAKYKALADANGGNLPLSGSQFVNDATQALQKANNARFLPAPVKEIMQEIGQGESMSFNDFENYRTILANEVRKTQRAGDGNATSAINTVRNALENIPMTEASAPIKALADDARSTARARFKLIEDNPAYKAAISDTRTPEEISLGMTHPAANNFLDKFYSGKTPEVYLNRLIQEIGPQSEAHQGLNAATIDRIKGSSGVKGNNTGNVSQAALNKQVHNVYGENLSTMMGNEGTQWLHDLADVARKSDPTAIPGNYSNVSKSGMVVNAGPIGQVAEQAGGLAASALEHAINLKTGTPAGSMARTFFKAKAEQEAAEKLMAERQAKLQRTLSPTAGIELQPPRVVLSGMANP